MLKIFVYLGLCHEMAQFSFWMLEYVISVSGEAAIHDKLVAGYAKSPWYRR